MPKTVEPGILTVGLWDKHFYQACGPSLTAHQQLPITFEYVYEECLNVDVALGTTGSVPEPEHGRRALWLQENREFTPHPPREVLESFDRVLTNDAALISSLPRGLGVWMPPIGTWLDTRAAQPPKSKMVSMIASAKAGTSGHLVRYEVAASVRGYDGFGNLFSRPVATKDEALRPYRYSIVIEACAYNHYFTEKLWDCFATRTIPVYSGPPDLAALESLDIDTSAILSWHTLGQLEAHLGDIRHHGETLYDSKTEAIERNFRAARRYYCAEVMLESVLRETFDLE